MELTLTRIAKRKTYTIGHLAIDDKPFCDTLEPTWRDIGWGRKGRKVAGRTAIPEGRYPVVVTFSPKFQKWLPLLIHVPLFTGIRIHAGNTVYPRGAESQTGHGAQLKYLDAPAREGHHGGTRKG